jgi:hypothetical protein
VTGGSVTGDGGAVRTTGTETLSLERSTLTGNHATSNGGGLWVGPGSAVTLNGTTASGNAADGGGGAAWSSGKLTLLHATVTDTTTTGGGAVERDPGATGALSILDSIVGTQASGPDCAGPVSSGGHNVAADLSCSLTGTGDQAGVDPKLGPLQDNGGYTPTHLPYVDSPAVDAEGGACNGIAPMDQRGVARPQHSACDSGAAEVKYTPVPMGAGRNFLGTGDDPLDVLPSALHENLWLAASGPCASAENGDLLLAQTDANWAFQPAPTDQNPGPMTGSTFWNRCTGSDAEGTTVANPTFDADGYFYAVDVPASAAGQTLRVDIYDGSACSVSHAGDGNFTPASAAYTTTYTIRAPDVNPAVPEDNPVVHNQGVLAGDPNVCGTSLTDWQDRWVNLVTVPNASAGTYFIQVRTSGGTSDPVATQGSNQFGLRAHFSSTWSSGTSPCSSDPTDTTHYAATCPTISAAGWMSVFSYVGSTFPTFFLGAPAQIPDRGRIVVEAWDPGEGTSGLSLVDPAGRTVGFDWLVVNRSGSDVAPTGGFGGSVVQGGGVPCGGLPPACVELDMIGQPNTTFPVGSSGYVRGWNPQPGPYRGSRGKYSDRLLQLTADLADDVPTEYGLGTRFQLRYHSSIGGLTDRTTWRAFIWETGESP